MSEEKKVTATQGTPAEKADTTPQAEKAKPAAKATPAAVKPAPAAKPSAAAKPAAKKEEPSPEVLAKTQAAQQLLDLVRGKIVKQFGENVLEETMLMKYQPTLVIRREHWRTVVTFLKEEPSLAFNYAEAFAGTDYPDKGYIELALYLYSMDNKLWITVKTRTPRDAASVPSLVPVFAGLNWEEREVYDLLGVTFTDHPDLRRIMMPEDYKGHPLRKDFSVWDE